MPPLCPELNMHTRALLPKMLLPCALSWFSCHAHGETGREVLGAHVACDGSLFSALARDLPRWRHEPSFARVGKLASFRVVNRAPVEHGGRYGDAMAIFDKPRELAGLKATGWFDSDVSSWSRFEQAGIRYISWGFYIDAPPETVRDALRRVAPKIAARMTPSSAPKAGVYCVQERFEEGRWQQESCGADEDYPYEPVPRRWMVIRPDGPDGPQSVLACEIAGRFEDALLHSERPDLKISGK